MHISGEAKCLACGHEWAAVAPCGTHRLECPECAVQRGVLRYPCELAAGMVYRCNCGSDVFQWVAHSNAKDYYLLCIGCGLQHFDVY
jgi:hypothetical protein